MQIFVDVSVHKKIVLMLERRINRKINLKINLKITYNDMVLC